MELLTLLLRKAGAFREWAGAGFRYAAGLAVLCVAPVLGLAHAAEKESLEKAVKAAYLSKFGLYVEWPVAALPAPNSALTLCVAGEDSLGAALDKAAADQPRGGRPIAIRRLKTVERDSGCHILYVTGSDAVYARQAIEAVRGSNCLTVSDARGTQVGAIIYFVVKDNRVRFDIDEEAAAENGLTISSKLLSLALNVKRRTPEETR
ncbi:MAG: YfiR family protein [Candidatus Binatia bacterium]